jgi:hypothetical protein
MKRKNGFDRKGYKIVSASGEFLRISRDFCNDEVAIYSGIANVAKIMKTLYGIHRTFNVSRF